MTFIIYTRTKVLVIEIFERRTLRMANRLTFVGNLANHIGQTVTIFTTSGGQSGRGFTGVLAAVYPTFVRLVTQIGSAPGCALGNCCNPHGSTTGPISGGCYDPSAGFGPEGAGFAAGYGAAGEVVADRTNEIAVDAGIGGIGTTGAGFGPGVGQGFAPGGGQGFAPGFAESAQLGGQGRASCSPITLGSVVDIPVDRIAAFVHNAIGSNY